MANDYSPQPNSEQFFANLLGVGKHHWFIPDNIQYECCRKCGIVRRADDKNGPCKGDVRLSLRDECTEGAA